MVHTRSGAGIEPYCIPFQYRGAHSFMDCPVCLDKWHIASMAFAPCGHAVCIKCVYGMIQNEEHSGTMCPICRCSCCTATVSDNGAFWAVVYSRGFYERSVAAVAKNLIING